MNKALVLSATISLCFPIASFATDYGDDIHQNDYKWSQFNLMYAVNQKPGNSDHDYLEVEFGGRSGVLDIYGYVDIFNLTSDPDSDKAKQDSKIFVKLAPRVSLDALTGADLSFGPVKELYISTEMNWDGNTTKSTGYAVNQQKIGLGSDIEMPFLGKVGFNVHGVYDSHYKDWNGVQVTTNWFKPFYHFENGSFLSYQGYIDYTFDMQYEQESDGGSMFNGFYWHSKQFAVGYGLKAYHDIYGMQDGGFAGDTRGVAHYFSLTYKM